MSMHNLHTYKHMYSYTPTETVSQMSSPPLALYFLFSILIPFEQRWAGLFVDSLLTFCYFYCASLALFSNAKNGSNKSLLISS